MLAARDGPSGSDSKEEESSSSSTMVPTGHFSFLSHRHDEPPLGAGQHQVLQPDAP